MALDLNQMTNDMIGAARGVLQNRWPDVRSYAESELKKLAHTIDDIGRMLLNREIDEDRARLLIQMQKNAARSVLLTVEGLGLLAAEAAINAALDVVRNAVNTAVGVALL